MTVKQLVALLQLEDQEKNVFVSDLHENNSAGAIMAVVDEDKYVSLEY